MSFYEDFCLEITVNHQHTIKFMKLHVQSYKKRKLVSNENKNKIITSRIS